jgi:LacI family transcriptional regulator
VTRDSERRPGLREVAARAGISISTASRALSGHPDIGEETRSRVVEAVRELGYEPNLLARGLRQGATQTIGFLVRDLASADVSEIVQGAEVALREQGYSVLLTNSEDRAELDAEHVRLLAARRVDGMLLLLADENARGTRASLSRLRIPMVAIDRELPLRFAASAALVDYRGGMRAVAEYLHGLGHRRVALVGAPQAIRPGRESAAALQAAGAELGLEILVEDGPWTTAHGFEATGRLLAAKAPPTAILAGSNRAVLGVLRAVRGAGLRVPGDVSVLVADDIPAFEFIEPPLTVLSQDPAEIGRVSARLLLDRLAGGPPATELVPMRLVERASAAPPAHSRDEGGEP